MSADNGVYILVTRRSGGKKEYRVAHFQCVENLTYEPDYPATHPEVNLDEVISRFGKSTVFTDRKFAEGYAIRWLEAIEREGVCEYGIKWLEFPTVRFPEPAQPSSLSEDKFDNFDRSNWRLRA